MERISPELTILTRDEVPDAIERIEEERKAQRESEDLLRRAVTPRASERTPKTHLSFKLSETERHLDES